MTENDTEQKVTINEDKNTTLLVNKDHNNNEKHIHITKRPKYVNSKILYATLQEHNDAESETWLYFIKYEGNEKALHHLQKQLDKVEFELLDDMATFDLELEYLVSELTAKEMTKVDLNAESFHRKFDGRLQEVDLDFKKRDGNETRICKTFDILGHGGIDDFISDEDETDNSDLSDDEDTDNESFSDSSEEETPPRRRKGVPSSVKQDIPRYAKIKQRNSTKKRHK